MKIIDLRLIVLFILLSNITTLVVGVVVFIKLALQQKQIFSNIHICIQKLKKKK